MPVFGTAFAQSPWDDRLPGAVNGVFVDEQAVDGEDATRPFTFGHERGHLLINGIITGLDDGAGHVASSQNLMHSPTSSRENNGASKRLVQVQVDTARQRSGPGSTNPLLRQE